MENLNVPNHVLNEEFKPKDERKQYAAFVVEKVSASLDDADIRHADALMNMLAESICSVRDNNAYSDEFRSDEYTIKIWYIIMLTTLFEEYKNTYDKDKFVFYNDNTSLKNKRESLLDFYKSFEKPGTDSCSKIKFL